MAFIPLDFTPSWPPILAVPCPDDHCKEPHQTYAAFILGPIPTPPRLALLDDRDARREMARPANGKHA